MYIEVSTLNIEMEKRKGVLVVTRFILMKMNRLTFSDTFHLSILIWLHSLDATPRDHIACYPLFYFSN